MTEKAAQIEREIALLTTEEQVLLHERLVRKLQTAEPDLAPEQLAELERRLIEIETGKIVGIPVDETFARLTEKLP